MTMERLLQPIHPQALQPQPTLAQPDSSNINNNTMDSTAAVALMPDDERTIPFLRRLYEMVQENPDTMSFLPGTGPPVIPQQGHSPLVSLSPQDNVQASSSSSNHRLGHIVVHDRKAVEKNVIPRYFNHSSFASLRRQLNYFNFERVGRGRQKGATYRNDSVVVLDDILRLKRRPNVNPGEGAEKEAEGGSAVTIAPSESFAAGITLHKECPASSTTADTRSQAETSGSSTLPQVQSLAQPQAIVSQALNEVSANPAAPYVQGQIPPPLQTYAPATVYALPNGTFGYAQPSQAQTVGVPLPTQPQPTVATVYYSSAQQMAVQLQAQDPVVSPCLSQVTQTPQEQARVPTTAPIGSVQMPIQFASRSATVGVALAPMQYSVACMQASAPLASATRVVSQSDMSTVSSADAPSQDAPAAATVLPPKAAQVPERSMPPRILLKKRPYYGTMFAKPSEEQDSEDQNKRVKLGVMSQDASAPAAAEHASSYCYSPPQSHAVLYGVPPPAVPVSPSLQEENQQQQVQQPGYYYNYSLPQHLVGANLAAPAQAFQASCATAPPPQLQTVQIVATPELSAIHTRPVQPLAKAVSPHIEITKETFTVSRKTNSRSIGDEVLYETKDGFPLKREDLLLCAALIHLGGPP